MDVYAPLAHRFGIATHQVGAGGPGLQDPAARALLRGRGRHQPDPRRARAADREARGAPDEGPGRGRHRSAAISGRPKHFYSIYRKMQAQEIGLDRIYDLLALRIIVETKADCYHALGILHSQFPPLADRIKDYIATPKPNMYQSIHSTVRVPGGKYIEVQIRTEEMHERGRAGHRRPLALQGGRRRGPGRPRGHGQVAAPDHGVGGGRRRPARVHGDAARSTSSRTRSSSSARAATSSSCRAGATPLDFAFRIHSEVGFRCIGAKVNGRIVTLRSELHNGDTVEILTSKTPSPSASWLEIVKTSRAKHHIRRWIKSTQFAGEREAGPRDPRARTGAGPRARCKRRRPGRTWPRRWATASWTSCWPPSAAARSPTRR